MRVWIVLAACVPSVAFAQVEVVESGPENEVALEVIETDQAQPANGYVQPQGAAQAAQPVGYTPQAQVLDDRLQLNQELDQVPIGGSIAMTTIGIGLGLVFSASAWLVKNASGVSRCLGDDGSECGTTNRAGTAVMGSLAAASFTLGIIGFIRLVVRIAKRARIRRDFRQRTTVGVEGMTLRF